MPARSKLNIRQRKFVNGYIANGGNASKAYKEAGYECSSRQTLDVMASRLIRNDKIESAIKSELLLMEKAAQITFERKTVWLGDIAEDGMQKTSPPDQSGSPDKPESMIDSRASIAAISELNRMQGHHAATNANINIQSVSFSQGIGQPTDLGSDEEKVIKGETIE